MKRWMLAVLAFVAVALCGATEPTGTTSVIVLYDYTNGVLWGRSGTNDNQRYIIANGTNYVRITDNSVWPASNTFSGVVTFTPGTNFPGHAAGAWYYHSDSNRVYWSDGTNWNPVPRLGE